MYFVNVFKKTKYKINKKKCAITIYFNRVSTIPSEKKIPRFAKQKKLPDALVHWVPPSNFSAQVSELFAKLITAPREKTCLLKGKAFKIGTKTGLKLGIIGDDIVWYCFF